MYSKSIVVAFGLLELVAGHATVVGVQGDANNVVGMGLSVTPGVNRSSQVPKLNAADPSNPEADTTTFGHGNAAATGCGKTAIAGPLQDAGAISNAVNTMAQMAGGVPAVSSGGQLQITMHQVNADGAPTYKADIDMTGTGTGTFTPINVVSGGQGAAGVLGDQGLSFNIGSLPANNTVVAQMPAGACTGTGPNGATNMCIVRLMNNAAAGGFGSCMAVTMGGATGATGTTGAAPATGTAGATSPSSTVISGTKARRHTRDVLKAREVPITWLS